MRRAPITLAAMIVIALAGTARPAGASGPACASLEVPAVVTAGEWVVLRWRGLPAEVEELEIVLSLDGGGCYHVRVSPELEAREAEYRWRVPDLPTARARLMLRVGGEAGERAGAFSREFRIVHVKGAPRPELGFHEGQFWTGIEPPAAPWAPGIAQDAPHFGAVADEAPCLPPEPILRAISPDSPRAPGVGATTALVCPGRCAGCAPREVPLRI